MSNTVELPAILDKELTKILKDYNILNQFEQSELRCHCCNLPVGWSNLGALMVVGEKLIFFCNHSECLEEAIQRESDGRS